MVIVGQNDPATGANRPNHLPDHGQRVGNMLEEKPRVRDVKGTPLLVSERKGKSVALSELDEVGFSVVARLSPRLGKLVGVALDSQNARSSAGHSGHGPCQLGQSASHIENRLAPMKVQLAQGRLVEKIVQS
jgi:hypothetical protein